MVIAIQLGPAKLGSLYYINPNLNFKYAIATNIHLINMDEITNRLRIYYIQAYGLTFYIVHSSLRPWRHDGLTPSWIYCILGNHIGDHIGDQFIMICVLQAREN